MGYMSDLKFWQIRTEFRNSPEAFRRTPIERWRVLGNPDTSKFPGWIGLAQVVGRSRDQGNLAAREDESRRKLCSDWPARPRRQRGRERKRERERERVFFLPEVGACTYLPTYLPTYAMRACNNVAALVDLVLSLAPFQMLSRRRPAG